MNTTLAIILSISALCILYAIHIFNKLITLRNRYRNAFAQIEVQLKRRYDLIPNLVESAKGYLKHEKETLNEVVQARNTAAKILSTVAKDPGNENAMKHLSSAEGTLTSALGNLNVVMESYPDLKSNQNMMQLSEELTSTENRVSFSRQAFNDQVMAYNTYKQAFHPVILAATFGHSKNATLLEFEDSKAIKSAPKISF